MIQQGEKFWYLVCGEFAGMNGYQGSAGEKCNNCVGLSGEKCSNCVGLSGEKCKFAMVI
jgi:hypothetical protein